MGAQEKQYVGGDTEEGHAEGKAGTNKLKPGGNTDEGVGGEVWKGDREPGRLRKQSLSLSHISQREDEAGCGAGVQHTRHGAFSPPHCNHSPPVLRLVRSNQQLTIKHNATSHDNNSDQAEKGIDMPLVMSRVREKCTGAGGGGGMIDGGVGEGVGGGGVGGAGMWVRVQTISQQTHPWWARRAAEKATGTMPRQGLRGTY
jgi:hypothetical protein